MGVGIVRGSDSGENNSTAGDSNVSMLASSIGDNGEGDGCIGHSDSVGDSCTTRDSGLETTALETALVACGLWLVACGL